jgi:hypothetical protein
MKPNERESVIAITVWSNKKKL